MTDTNASAGGPESPDDPSYPSNPLASTDGAGASSVNGSIIESVPESNGVNVNADGGLSGGVNSSEHRGARSFASVSGHFVVRQGRRLLLNGKPFVANGWNTYWLMYEAAIPQERYLVSAVP